MATIKRIKEGDYDASSKTLTIRGKDTLGRDVETKFSILDANMFLGWIAGVLFEKQPDDGGKGILVTNLSFGIHGQDGNYQMSISLQSGNNFKINFLLPMGEKAPERMFAIQSHLEQALKEMGSFEPVERH